MPKEKKVKEDLKCICGGTPVIEFGFAMNNDGCVDKVCYVICHKCKIRTGDGKSKAVVKIWNEWR